MFITAKKLLQLRRAEDLDCEMRIMGEILKNYISQPNDDEEKDKAFFTYLMHFKEKITDFKLSNSSLYGVDY